MEKFPVISEKTGQEYMVKIEESNGWGYRVSLNIERTEGFFKKFFQWKELEHRYWFPRFEPVCVEDSDIILKPKFGFVEMANSIVQEYEHEIERKEKYQIDLKNEEKEFKNWDGKVEKGE